MYEHPKYSFYKVLKTLLRLYHISNRNQMIDGNRILFLSRQSNEIPLSFRMLQDRIQQEKEDVSFVTICHRIEKGLLSRLTFLHRLLRSTRELARCKVCVLDSYWPAVSVLSHHPSQSVIQIWHAAGKIKQSGYQTLGKRDGRDAVIANIMGMHRNYDYVIAGNPKWNPFYIESFHIDREKILNLGLPSLDALVEHKLHTREKIYSKYPALRDKPVVLYAPTFRRHPRDDWKKFIRRIDKDRFHVVVKAHPNQPLQHVEGAFLCEEFHGRDLLAAADYVVTDYSSIALEAAALRVRTYYYLYDYEDYCEYNGVNIRHEEEMPGCVFYEEKSLCQAIERGHYNMEILEAYRQKNLPANLGHCTEDIANLILQECNRK